MARGFESKGAAEYAETRTDAGDRKLRMSSEQIDGQKKREELELSRARLNHELEATSSDVRRKALRAALSHIEGEIAKLT
jgi:hypothetical protein